MHDAFELGWVIGDHLRGYLFRRGSRCRLFPLALEVKRQALLSELDGRPHAA